MVVANKVKLLKRSHLICHKEQTRIIFNELLPSIFNENLLAAVELYKRGKNKIKLSVLFYVFYDYKDVENKRVNEEEIGIKLKYFKFSSLLLRSNELKLWKYFLPHLGFTFLYSMFEWETKFLFLFRHQVTSFLIQSHFLLLFIFFERLCFQVLNESLISSHFISSHLLEKGGRIMLSTTTKEMADNISPSHHHRLKKKIWKFYFYFVRLFSLTSTVKLWFNKFTQI